LSKNILIWLDYSFLHFGIAKSLSKNDYNLFGIIDSQESINQFFQNQKIVKFSKLWYLYESISIKSPDLEYLKKFEEKYGINIWSIVYTDRYFYKKFNPFYQFKYEEILSLIEQECKFFEKIISEKKFDYVLSNTITHHYQYLFYKICKSIGIPVLTFEPFRFGNRWLVMNGTMYDFDQTKYSENPTNPSEHTTDEIEKLTKATGRIEFEKKFTTPKISKLQKIRAFFNLLFFPGNLESTKRFSTYGRTRKNILFKGTARMFLLKKKYREFFINNNFSYSVSEKTPFVYFPLHLDPERVLLMGAPFYVDQLSVITNIAKSLPAEFKLYVKEHPNMKTQGWREKRFYQQIMELPNVELIHPSIPSEELIRKCKLVITIKGTASIEAIQHGKPSIVFKEDIEHTNLPSIHVLKNLEELPVAILQSISKKVSPSEIYDNYNFIKKNSFVFDSPNYSLAVSKHFNYSIGYLNQVNISKEQMESFLKEFQWLFEMLSSVYNVNITKWTEGEQLA